MEGAWSDLPRAQISIAMATFNGARFLGAQLASLAAQSHPPFELVVCDDGSSDGTFDILRDFAIHAPFPVDIYRNPTRLDYRTNFMKAASLTSGSIVSFCDQDDLWHPDKLRRVARAFDDAATMLVVHRAEWIDEEDRIIGEPGGADMVGKIDLWATQGPWCLFPGFAQSFRASLLDHADLWTDSKSHFMPGIVMGHDRWITFVAAALGVVVHLPDRLVCYRQHGANVYGAMAPAARGGGRQATIRQDRQRIAYAREAAADRIRMLEEMARRPVGEGNASLQNALSRYRDWEARLALRERVQRHDDRTRRLGALLRLLVARAYGRGDPWRFSRRALLDDLLVNLPSGPSFV